MVSRTRFLSASLSSVTLQRFGRKRRLVRRLAWLTLLPVSTALPVSSQRRAMILYPSLPIARNPAPRLGVVGSANAVGGGHIRGRPFWVKAPPQTCAKLQLTKPANGLKFAAGF